MVEDGTRGELGGIHFEFEGFIVIRLSEDGVSGGKVNETVEGRGAFRGLDEGCPLFKEV